MTPVLRVRQASCPQCWQKPGPACTLSGGNHLARWQRAERLGLISGADLAFAAAGLEVIAEHVVIGSAVSEVAA